MLLVKPKRSAPVTKAAPVAKKQQESEDESEHEEQVNHSYSRMMYGPEDGIDSDEVDEDVNDSSKPKIFSFAELGDIAGWEPSSSNIANKSDFQYPELPAKPVSSQPKTSSATETKTSSISIAKSTAPSAEAKSEVKTIVPTQKSAAPVPAQPVPAPVVPTNYPPQEVPSSSAQPNYGHHPTQQAPPPAYQQPHQQPLPHYPPQYQQPPQHYPYAYPPAPPSAGDANNAAHQPPPPPYGYPQYPPYHHMPHSPHMPPYGYPPYGYSYPPMPHMPYAPYPYPPMYHYPPVDGMGAMNQQAAMLASMSASSSLLANKSVGSSSTPMVSQMQNQPIILELLQELSKVQEEANWARKKLAETIIMLNQNNGSTRGSVEVQTPALALPKSNHGGDNTKGRYDQEDDEDDYEDDEVDDSNEYSEDFELSNLNLSTSFRKPPSVKGKAKKTFPNETFKKVEQKPVEATKDEEKTLPSPTENISPPYLPKQSENVRFSQDLHSDGNKVRGLGIPSFTTTNEFLDPFTDSVARSFLASQVSLFSIVL